MRNETEDFDFWWKWGASHNSKKILGERGFHVLHFSERDVCPLFYSGDHIRIFEGNDSILEPIKEIFSD